MRQKIGSAVQGVGTSRELIEQGVDCCDAFERYLQFPRTDVGRVSFAFYYLQCVMGWRGGAVNDGKASFGFKDARPLFVYNPASEQLTASPRSATPGRCVRS